MMEQCEVALVLSLVSILLNGISICKKNKHTKAVNISYSNSIRNPHNGYNVQEFYDPNGKLVYSRHWCDTPWEGKK